MELEKEKFKSWLESLPEETEFFAGSCLSCPIAKYLSDNTGREYSVSLNECGPRHEPFSYPLPEWAKDFISILDNTGGEKKSIADCLEILEEIT